MHSLLALVMIINVQNGLGSIKYIGRKIVYSTFNRGYVLISQSFNPRDAFSSMAKTRELRSPTPVHDFVISCRSSASCFWKWSFHSF
jgi:hypothetical protein